MTTQGDVLEKNDLKTTDGGDHDRFAHYFKKTDIERAFFDGATITALCGKKDRPVRDFAGYPICPTCKEILAELPQ